VQLEAFEVALQGPLRRRPARLRPQDPGHLRRNTIDRWCRWWRIGGFAALVPKPARVPPRTPAEVLDLAAAVKKETWAARATRVLP
jgi:hypothetical protein